MFGLFAKKPSTEEAVSFIKRAIRDANILIHWEDGNYAAFMFMTNVTSAGFAKHLTYQESVGALIHSVESRIEAGDFDADDEEDLTAFRSPYWKPNLLAKRIIVATDKPIYSWDIEIGDDGMHKISLEEIGA